MHTTETPSRSQKIAQIFSPAAFIHDSEAHYLALEKLIQEENIGGLTFFHSRSSAAANFEKRAEVLDVSGTLEKLILLINRYQRAAKTPLLISIDGEYGLAMRVEHTPQYPFAITLGGIEEDALHLIEEVGYRMGRDMKRAGIHLNLAPCADSNTNPDNPVIGYRSFGTEREKVAQMAYSAYSGMKRAGIGACLKHFPGHGDTHTDSHLGLPVLQKSKEQLFAQELFPFQYGIDRGVEMIMVGHLAVPALTGGDELPASISHALITDLLKGEMGFKGLVISDALNMKAIAQHYPEPGQLEWEAFRAGNDILCFSDHVREGIQWISDHGGDEQIDQAYQKIYALKQKLGVLEFREVAVPEFDWQDHTLFQTHLAEKYIHVLHGAIDYPAFRHLATAGKLHHRTYFCGSHSHFSESLDQLLGVQLEAVEAETAEKILISVYVPSHKPLNHFGMDPLKLAEIHHLTQHKKCILVHFGNPLALKHLGDTDNFEAVFCCYQSFEEVQEVMADRLAHSN